MCWRNQSSHGRFVQWSLKIGIIIYSPFQRQRNFKMQAQRAAGTAYMGKASKRPSWGGSQTLPSPGIRVPPRRLTWEEAQSNSHAGRGLHQADAQPGGQDQGLLGCAIGGDHALGLRKEQSSVLVWVLHMTDVHGFPWKEVCGRFCCPVTPEG